MFWVSEGEILETLRSRFGHFIAKAWFSYAGKIPDDRGFYFLADHPRFSADISDNRQKSVPDSPGIEFGRKWKVLQKLKFVHKRMIGGLEPSNLRDW